MSIIGYGNKTSSRANNVVRQPAFLLSSQKDLEWWAEGGLVYCFNPNKPGKGATYLQPEEALQRVATMIKLCVADCKEKPQDYVVSKSVMAAFFNEFKTRVFDVALEQDEAMGGGIRKTNEEFARARQERAREMAIQHTKASEKRTKMYLPPRAQED